MPPLSWQWAIRSWAAWCTRWIAARAHARTVFELSGNILYRKNEKYTLASERCINLVCSPPHIHVLACGQSRILKQGTHILAHEQALADTLAHHARTVAVAHALSEQLRTQDEGELDVPFVLFFTSYVIMVVRYCAMPITPSLRQ